MNKSTAILMLSHVWNPTVAARFQRMRREVGQVAECFLLLDNAHDQQFPMENGGDESHVKIFDQEELSRVLGYPYFGLEGIEPGSCHFPMIHFSRETSYDHYWLVEYDVEYTGHWGGLIAACEDEKADLLASHAYSQQESPYWMWWSSIKAPTQSATRPQDLRLLKVFLPIYRMSREALAFMDAQHIAGWSGQYEVLMPTLLNHHGYKVADLLKVGRFYRGAEQDPTAESGRQSTLRYRPEITLSGFVADFTPDTIYHPVKEPWTYDGSNVLVAVSPVVDEPARLMSDEIYPVRAAGYSAAWEDNQLTLMRLATPPIMKDTKGVLLLKGRGRENL